MHVGHHIQHVQMVRMGGTLSIYKQDSNKGTLLQSWHTELLKLHSVCYKEYVPHVLQQNPVFFKQMPE
jgi:hypothetical protein